VLAWLQAGSGAWGVKSPAGGKGLGPKVAASSRMDAWWATDVAHDSFTSGRRSGGGE